MVHKKRSIGYVVTYGKRRLLYGDTTYGKKSSAEKVVEMLKIRKGFSNPRILELKV